MFILRRQGHHAREERDEMARKVKVEIIEDGKVLESAVALSWMAFLNGKWTKERPERPGKYVIANRAGRVTGEVFVFYDAETKELTARVRDGALCTIKELDGEHIWWWSRAMPQLMPAAVPRKLGERVTEEDLFGTPSEIENHRKWLQQREKNYRESGRSHLVAVPEAGPELN